MYKQIIKPLLFTLSPEKAHHFTLKAMKTLLGIPFLKKGFSASYHFEHENLEQNIMGLHFKNPVGLAAGFDKDGKSMKAMAQLGFGFIEVGTVTPKPQAGNPAPRLFRLPKDKAILNRMGFNNEGIEKLVERLKKHKPQDVIIGGNIGKNKNTSNDDAVIDYETAFLALHPFVDYFVVNVSSPNTPNLRQLQQKEPLKNLLSHLQKLNQQQPKRKPILLKIAPDMDFSDIDDIIDIVLETNIEGVVATNTTVHTKNLKTNMRRLGQGGISGAPLRERSTKIIQYIRQKAGKNIIIIGVGGIFSATDAIEKINAGANLIQIYTGLIYEGPSIVNKIKQAMSKKIFFSKN